MASQVIKFEVYGDPQPKGSMHTYGNGYVVHSNKSKQWEKDIVDQITYHGELVLEAVEVRLTFYMKRPKTVKNRLYPHVSPDLDKLVRAVLDAITDVLIKDDGQVVSLIAKKLYTVSDNELPGVMISIKGL